MRNAVQEVAGAIERIDHPPPRPVVRPGRAGFLHQEGVAGPRLGQVVADRLLGAQIGLADEIARSLHAHLQLLDLGEVAQQALGSALGSVLHHRHVRRKAHGHGI